MQSRTKYRAFFYLAMPLLIAAESCIAQTSTNQTELAALLASQQWAEAIAKARVLAADTQPAKIRLAALEGLAIALAGAGEERESERVAAQAEALFAEQETARLAKSSVYYRNRSAYDGRSRYAISLLRRRQAAAEAGGHSTQAVPAVVSLAVRFPEHPERRAFALGAAEKLLALGRPDEAAPWLLAALDTGLDRSFGSKAKLSENQVQLDAVAKPLTEEHVQRVLVGLLPQEMPQETKSPVSTIEDHTSHIGNASSFHRALCLTIEEGFPKGILALESLLQRSPFSETPCHDIVRLEIARTHLREGHAREAMEALERIEPERAGLLRRRTAWGEAVAAHRAFLEGVVANLMIDRPAAAKHFATAAALGGAPLADAARYEQARSLELDGQWKSARKLYRKLAKDCPATSARRLAESALARLDLLDGASLPEHPAVVQISDDRETRGDWFLGYGTSHYVLCAHNYRQDISGGLGPKLQLAFATTDPKEPSRLWVSSGATDDPAALWDPRRRCRFPANRDDCGEQYAIGSGPHLVVDAAVPDGRHLLSLYFVNDHRYYESNRRYTIEIRSGDQLLALADVRDFGTGVYKRFLVDGPRDLRIRLRRDASMNVLLQGIFLDAVSASKVQSSEFAVQSSGTLSTEDTEGTEGGKGVRNGSLSSRFSQLLALSQPIPHSDFSLLHSSPSPSSQIIDPRPEIINPRAARAALEFLVASLPPEQLLPAARELAARMGDGDPFFGMHAAQWPDSIPHPVDLLNARWFAAKFVPPAPGTPLSPLDASDQALLRAIVLRREPQATPFACSRALALLEERAPRALTASFLAAAGGQLKQQGDAKRAVLLLHRALAAKPDVRTELGASVSLLDIAPEVDLPVMEVRSLFRRASALASNPGDAHLVPFIHLHAAEALARQGETAEALALLEEAPPKLAAPLRRACQRRLAERKKEPRK